MKDFTTAKLPLNFIFLGSMLIALGIWRLLVQDWSGIFYLLTGIILFFLRSGIVIDPKEGRIKRYTGLFGIKSGNWESISPLSRLQVVKRQETQLMHVLSLSRIENKEVYRLFLLMPDAQIELMSGEKELILKRAEEISGLLSLSYSLRS